MQSRCLGCWDRRWGTGSGSAWVCGNGFLQFDHRISLSITNVPISTYSYNHCRSTKFACRWSRSQEWLKGAQVKHRRKVIVRVVMVVADVVHVCMVRMSWNPPILFVASHVKLCSCYRFSTSRFLIDLNAFTSFHEHQLYIAVGEVNTAEPGDTVRFGKAEKVLEVSPGCCLHVFAQTIACLHLSHLCSLLFLRLLGCSSKWWRSTGGRCHGLWAFRWVIMCEVEVEVCHDYNLALCWEEVEWLSPNLDSILPQTCRLIMCKVKWATQLPHLIQVYVPLSVCTQVVVTACLLAYLIMATRWYSVVSW